MQFFCTEQAEYMETPAGITSRARPRKAKLEEACHLPAVSGIYSDCGVYFRNDLFISLLYSYYNSRRLKIIKQIFIRVYIRK